MTAKKDGRGGRRPGAGRPPTIAAVAATTTDLPQDLRDALHARAAAEGCSVADLTRRALRLYLPSTEAIDRYASSWRGAEQSPRPHGGNGGAAVHRYARWWTADERIAAALELAVRHGGHDGEHHKAWVIDQMVRVLAGDHYDALVAAARAGDDGPETYDWDTGVAP